MRDKKKVLKPVITGAGVAATQIYSGISQADQMSDPAPGELLVVRVNADSTEVPNSAFYIGERTFNNKFAGKPGYAVKKKAK